MISTIDLLQGYRSSGIETLRAYSNTNCGMEIFKGVRSRRTVKGAVKVSIRLCCSANGGMYGQWL